VGLLAAAGLLILTGLADAAWWVRPAVQTCQRFGVPGALVVSIILAESGGEPYAIRVNQGRGVAVFPRTYEAGARAAEVAVRFTPNVDLGLMQVNFREWGRPLGLTPAQLLRPDVNLLVGCAVLKQALETDGPAWQRVGRYHSPHPARQRAYAGRVAAWLRALLR